MSEKQAFRRLELLLALLVLVLLGVLLCGTITQIVSPRLPPPSVVVLDFADELAVSLCEAEDARDALRMLDNGWGTRLSDYNSWRVRPSPVRSYTLRVSIVTSSLDSSDFVVNVTLAPGDDDTVSVWEQRGKSRDGGFFVAERWVRMKDD